MKIYTVNILPEAKDDIDDIFHHIMYEIKQPQTAIDYYNGILETIMKLRITGDSLAVAQNQYLQNRYGPEARIIHYKKVSVIFNVIDNVVHIRRITAAKLIR